MCIMYAIDWFAITRPNLTNAKMLYNEVIESTWFLDHLHWSSLIYCKQTVSLPCSEVSELVCRRGAFQSQWGFKPRNLKFLSVMEKLRLIDLCLIKNYMDSPGESTSSCFSCEHDVNSWTARQLIGRGPLGDAMKCFKTCKKWLGGLKPPTGLKFPEIPPCNGWKNPNSEGMTFWRRVFYSNAIWDMEIHGCVWKTMKYTI